MRLLSCALFLTCVTAFASAADDFKLEPGFTLMFGKDLTGWQEKTGNASLDGKSEAYKGRFKLADGVLTIDPSVKGDVRIQTAKKLEGDVHIKFDFKPDAKCNNDLFIRGQKFDLVKSGVKNLKEDDWNKFEVIIKGDKAEFKNNGETQRMATIKDNAATVFEIRAEFGGVQIRHLRVMSGAK